MGNSLRSLIRNAILEVVGVWRSSVAHSHGVRGVVGSNPITPTNIYLQISLVKSFP